MGNKSVFKIKHCTMMDRSIDKFKACLLVKGFTQIEGVDYEETFFSCGEICLYSPPPSSSCPLGLSTISNGRKDCIPQRKP